MDVRQAWITAVESLGGALLAAQSAGDELEQRYSESHRRYHTLDHIRAVLADGDWLSDQLSLVEVDRSLLALAICAHDVVYDARPGDDEQASAAWARAYLEQSRLPDEYVRRVVEAVLATASHSTDGREPVAACLLDADLAILAAPAELYDLYAANVRLEYSHLDDTTWQLGRTHGLRQLIDRAELFVTSPGRERWDAAARGNLERELARWADSPWL